MSDSDFSRAMAFVRIWEGGRVDDPRDPGGRTAYGCTQRTFDAWCLSVGKPKRDVYTITAAELNAIYKRDYWDKVAPGRPWPLNAVLMDTAVNCGVGRALRWLEEAKLTTNTSNPRRMAVLAAKVMTSRQQHYYRLGGYTGAPMTYAYRGWMNRWRALAVLAGTPVQGG